LINKENIPKRKQLFLTNLVPIVRSALRRENAGTHFVARVEHYLQPNRDRDEI